MKRGRERAKLGGEEEGAGGEGTAAEEDLAVMDAIWQLSSCPLSLLSESEKTHCGLRGLRKVGHRFTSLLSHKIQQVILSWSLSLSLTLCHIVMKIT